MAFVGPLTLKDARKACDGDAPHLSRDARPLVLLDVQVGGERRRMMTTDFAHIKEKAKLLKCPDNMTWPKWVIQGLPANCRCATILQ